MTPPRALARSDCQNLVAALLAMVLVGSLLSPVGRSAAAELERRSVPTPLYFAAFSRFYDGQFDDALKIYEEQWRGGIRTLQTRWLDSICYYTMMGECFYHMGQPDRALEQYTAAVRLYVTFPDWMLRVSFPPQIRPDTSSNFRQIPWASSARKPQIGQIPETMLIGQGQINNLGAYQQGGVVQQAVMMGINAKEIVRCTALAIRRRTELLGPIAAFDPLTADLISELSRSPAPPNHWSQAWVDIELALALIAGGKSAEAVPLLNRSIVAAGQFDHPLTSTALFELGRLALMQANYAEAVKQFEEASYSAAYFQDYSMIEESLRYAAIARLQANPRDFYPLLAPVAQWARVKGARYLQASVLLSGAENYLTLRQDRQATATLEEAQGAIGRRAMGLGVLGARLNYLHAMGLFQQRKTEPGREALANALNFMQRASLWLLQIRLVDQQYTAGQMSARGSITPRTAVELYGRLLRDPQPIDWALNPLESLSVLRTPHPEAFEHWFLIALERKEYETAIEIADRARRHRFLSSLELGGRLEGLRWILEAPEDALSRPALDQRQTLLGSHPEYGKLADQAKPLRKSLQAMPVVAQDAESLRKQSELLGQLAKIAAQQDAILYEAAIRREPADLVFPPIRATKDIQAALPQGSALLVFFSAGGDLYGFLLNGGKYAYWRVKQTAALPKRITGMLHEIGQYEANRELSLKELADTSWKESSKRVLDSLLEGSQADFAQQFPELVIVPDGILWYLPFEALEVKVADKLLPLISRFRIRYAPTASLAVTDRNRANPTARTVVVLGRLSPRQDEAVIRSAFEQFAKSVPGSAALTAAALPAASGLYATLLDRLVVLDDIAASDHPFGWSPIPLDRGKPGSSLADWLALPFGGPWLVVLPGFHTAAESALKRFDRNSPGSEVFLAICGLMANGARTILLSRWRTGGQSSFDLVREFTQELPDSTPSDAWQRAVLVTASSRMTLEAEPRIKPAPNEEPPKGTHPFFWAGFMLVDSGVPAEKKAEQPGQPAQPGAAKEADALPPAEEKEKKPDAKAEADPPAPDPNPAPTSAKSAKGKARPRPTKTTRSKTGTPQQRSTTTQQPQN